MSAFMVSVDCMQRAVAAVRMHAREYVYRSAHPVLWQIVDDEDELAAAMFAMNRDALDSRYPGRYPEAKRIPSYEPREACRGKVDRVDAYKALECFLYQCSEDGITERPLFLELEAIQRTLAGLILRDLPEYERAAWG